MVATESFCRGLFLTVACGCEHGLLQANTNLCERDVPQCDSQYNDSFFFTDIVQQIVPYTVGAMVWDQAERDVKCPVSTAAYACMQRLLTRAWRRSFASPEAAFVAVQLPGTLPTVAPTADSTSHPTQRRCRTLCSGCAGISAIYAYLYTVRGLSIAREPVQTHFEMLGI